MEDCIYTDSFTFNNVNCNTLGYTMCWFDKRDEKIDTGLKIKIEQDSFNIQRNKYNQYGVTYDGPLKFEFGIMKTDQSFITPSESYTLNQWLRTDCYYPFHFNGDNKNNITYYAICTDIVDIYMGDLIGKQLTFECNSPFGYSPIEECLIEGGNTVVVNNISDDGIYYPKIKIVVQDDYTDKIIIENLTDQKSVTYDFSESDDKEINIDSEKSMITNANGKILPAYKLGWNENYSSILSNENEEMSELYWPRLLSGKNIIKVVGNCTVYIYCEFPRKIGSVL